MFFMSNYMLLNQYYCSKFWSKGGISTLEFFFLFKSISEGAERKFQKWNRTWSLIDPKRVGYEVSYMRLDLLYTAAIIFFNIFS